MKINLNLATRPYIELRPVYARLRVLGVALAVLALPLLLLVHVEETQGRDAENRVNQLSVNTELLRQQQADARALALEGPNANVLTQAAYLNDMFRRKAFSWTATMSDLEDTLPYGVQVFAIQPVIAADGRVAIRLGVTGPRALSVEVVRNLEHSKHFAAPRLAAESLADVESGAQKRNIAASNLPAPVRFDILADYRPLPNSHDNAGVEAGAPGGPVSQRVKSKEAQLTNPDAAVPARRHHRVAPGVPAALPSPHAFAGSSPASARGSR